MYSTYISYIIPVILNCTKCSATGAVRPVLEGMLQRERSRLDSLAAAHLPPATGTNGAAERVPMMNAVL